jgi:RimJ/RimL family protein N-acetyltransferase
MKKLDMPNQIETERLTLRKLDVEDGAVMFQRVDSNRKAFEEFFPWVKPTKTQADSEAYIKLSLKNWEESISFDFSILEKETNNYIGNLGLHTLSLEHLRGEFGYWLDAEAQGRGYMTEAVRALEKVCFSAGLNRLEIRCAPSNDKSSGVPKKLGYLLDGRLRSNFVVNDQIQDTLVFSKIRSDLTPR